MMKEDSNNMSIRTKVIKTTSKKSRSSSTEEYYPSELPLKVIFIYAALGLLGLGLILTLIDTYM